MRCIAVVVAFALGSYFTGSSAKTPAPAVTGDYLEVRSCDVYTGSCVANSEMGLSGREGMLVWSIRDGLWNGISLRGLNVIAVVRAENTLGDVNFEPRHGRAVLIVDARADSLQEKALQQLARTMGAKVIQEIAAVKVATIEVSLGECTGGSCARVKAGNLLEIATRCLGGKDHLCGNEDNYYPPLSAVQGAFTAYTELAAYRGPGLNLTWELTGKRSAYLAKFSAP